MNLSKDSNRDSKRAYLFSLVFFTLHIFCMDTPEIINQQDVADLLDNLSKDLTASCMFNYNHADILEWKARCGSITRELRSMAYTKDDVKRTGNKVISDIIAIMRSVCSERLRIQKQRDFFLAGNEVTSNMDNADVYQGFFPDEEGWWNDVGEEDQDVLEMNTRRS